MDMTTTTAATTTTTSHSQCPKAKLPKGQDLVGYCANCDRPVIMALRGIRVRSAKFVLTHTDSTDAAFVKYMARTGQTIR